MSRWIFGPGVWVLGGGAVLLGTFLVVGLLLPTDWSARAEARIDADRETLLRLLDSPEGWTEWTPWPDSTTRSGPERGAGAAISWESRELGSGAFTIVEADSDGVRYTVEVAGAGDAVMLTRGSVRLTPEGAATRVVWEEEGDLGRNPLMGWWGLTMDEAQSTELGKSLDRLAEVAAETSPMEPDSAMTDSATAGSTSPR